MKIGDIRPVNKKDIPEKPQGIASTPSPCAGEVFFSKYWLIFNNVI